MDFLSLFGSLLSYLLLYKYAALFILVFLAGVGLPIPSNTLLRAVGAFASQDYFNLPLSFAIALVANISGDVFDYFLMRKYGQYIISKNYHKKFSFFVKFENKIKLLEAYIKGHLRLTIFVTRFVGTASMIVNLLSGLIPISSKTFFLYDAVGNFLDIGIMVLLGFFISESWQSVAGIIGTISTTIYVLILIALVIFIFIKKINKQKQWIK